MMPSGLTYRHYMTIAEREGKRLVALDEGSLLVEGDLIHLGDSEWGWTAVDVGSPLIGQKKGVVAPWKDAVRLT